MANSFLADFVDVWPNTIRTRQYHDVLATIGQVHRVANLPARKIAAVGHLPSIQPGMQGICIFNPATHEPGIIGIAATALTPLFTMAHEFGHCIDHALKKTIILTNSMDAGEAYSEVFDAIHASDEHKKLVAEQYGTEVSLVAISRLVGQTAADSAKQRLKQIRYLLEPAELFARSYSQYIALQSGNEALQADLTQYINYREDDPYHQWQDQSFQPICEAFARLFANIGWTEK